MSLTSKKFSNKYANVMQDSEEAAEGNEKMD
jgi:hypothetical protein